jgi:hypothetical protein
MTAAPKYGSLLKSHGRGLPVCRTSFPKREAGAPREEMGECTWETRRGMGPVASARIPGIMSGRSHDQQGMAATCEDSTHEVNEGGERRWDWRMSPYEL